MDKKNLDISSDPSSLTSFGEPKEESSSSTAGFFKFVLDFFSNKKSDNEATGGAGSRDQTALIRPNVLNLNQPGKSKRKSLQRQFSGHQPGSEVEVRLRSFSTFLRDFPKLVRGPQSPDSDDNQPMPTSPALSVEELRQYWMPDDQCHECYECGEKFTTFRRRHHCRICGQIFCSRCCNQLISGTIMGLQGMLRSCMYCCRLVLRFAEGNKPDVAKAISQSLNGSTLDSTFDEQINESNSIESLSGVQTQNKVYDQLFNSHRVRQQSQSSTIQRVDSSFGEDQLFDAGPSSALSILSPVIERPSMQTPGFIFDATQLELSPTSILGTDVKNDLVKDSLQLHLIWRKVCDEKEGIEFRDHRFRLRKYSNCITGQEFIDWLLKNDLASNRTQGRAIGQALCEGQWMKSVLDDGGIFQDGYVLFQSRKNAIHPEQNRIEIYPDHFSASDDHDGSTLQNLAQFEPVWVQEIKCNGGNDDEIEGDFGDYSDTDLTWSDAQSSIPNDMLLYSDEDQSISERSVVSLSSYVEINEGDEVIKYTRSSNSGNTDLSKPLKSSVPIQPMFEDASLTNISAEYLRSFITWNGTFLNHPWHRPSSGWREVDLQSKSLESCDKRAFHWLREMYLRHNLAFLRQMLRDKGLDIAWADILIPLARHASFHISPDPNVNMDVCHYVQIKKVPDGHRRESSIINGVVFTKNVVNKNMRTDILNPSILLLAIPLEYERVQLKLSALDPVVRQEREFYKHLITRVTSKHPDVILAQCTVSRIAQELLLEAGITVVVNVKRSVMERIARSTEADIVYSIDQLLQANLGRCSRIYLKRHVFHEYGSLNDETSKTFLYFDGCDPLYGCTVILRETGSNSNPDFDVMSDLVKIKDVFRFLVRAMFHVRLELSYLIDQHNFGKLLKKHGSVKSNRSDSEIVSNSFEDTILENTIVSNNEGLLLRNPQLQESSVLLEAETSQSHFTALRELANLEQINTHGHLFEKALKSVLLSTSPLIHPKMPYLHSDQGQKSTAWKFLPAKILDFHDKETGNMQIVSHRSDVPANYAEVQPPIQEIPWFSHLQPAEPSNDLIQNIHNPTAEDIYNKKQTSKEISAENGHSNGNQMKKSHDAQRPMSCYSKQHRRTKFDDGTNISDALSSMKQLDNNHGQRTWEQTMIDMIFGPPSNAYAEKKSGQSVFHTSDPKTEVRSNSRSFKKFNGQCTNNRRLFSEMSDESLHEFISFSFTQSASTEEVRDLLSSFRAHAGSLFHRIDSDKHDYVEEANKFQTPVKRPVTSILKSVANPGIDSLDPCNHQHIAVLFSSYSLQSPNAPHFCVLPWVVKIDFYRGNDITLGGFLERYCFRPSYHCPNAACRRPMVEHVRSFVYGNMCMSVLLKELSKPFQQSSILTWTWDHATKKSSSIKAMSHDAWFMSFAKFLELNLGSLSIPDMGSSPYQQQGILKQEVLDEDWELRPFNGFQYFLFRDLIAAFKCFPIQLNEVLFPATFLSRPTGSDILLSCGKICNGCYDDFSTPNDAYYVCKILWEKIERTSEDIDNCIHSSQDRRVMNDTSSEEIPLSREKYFLELLSCLNNETSSLKERVGEMEYFLKNNGFTPLENIAPFPDLLESNDDDEFDESPLPENLRSRLCLCVLQLKCDISQMVQTWNHKLADAYDKDKTSFWNPPKSKLSSSPHSQRKKIHGAIQEEKDLHETTDIDVAFQGAASCPSNVLLANDFHDSVTRGSSDIDISEDLLSLKNARRLKRGVSAESKVYEKPARRTRTGSNMKFLVARLLPGNVLSPSCPMPFPADEHYLLPECLASGVVVRDTEPTSIIAYTLCSSDYKKAVKCDNTSSDTLTTEDAQKEEIVFSGGHAAGNGEPSENTVFLDGSSFENPMMKENEAHQTSVANSVSSDHIEVQFADATTRFYCKVYFAQLFQKFRSQVLEGGENQYLTSMSRSVKWLARGGKSGLAFHKTRDDQFILKQMSSFEMQSFLEFAPKYVTYVASCMENDKVTAISKILGVYRISFRNSETGRSLKDYFLVIENLFYGKKVNRIFDLKGSVRNRHVKPTSKESAKASSKKEDVVLLDENLLKIMCETPIYVHEHTKFLLNSAMQRDTEFLSQNLIMDYSLLIGMDADNQIFIGIIDFIRTFTWDKKLEMVVKWSSSRSMPTVVSPELYKNRFCEAMDRYFLVVPDRWYGMRHFEDNSIRET